MRSYLLFVRSQWKLLLFGFMCVFWGNLGQSFFLGWYGDAIKAELNISAQQYGAIYSFATLCSAITIVWLGAFVDHWSLRRYVLLVCAGLMCACLVLYGSSSVFVLCVGFYLIRLFGQGLMPHTGLTIMARHFHESRGKAISLASSAVSIGEVLLPLVAVYLIATLSWRESWLWISLTIPCVLLPSVLGLLRSANWQDAHLAGAVGSKKVSGRMILICDKRYWFAAPTILSIPFVLTALFIHQDFILLAKSWAHEWMAACFVIYGVVHWCSSMTFGVLVDRWGGLKLFRFYTLPVILALLCVANLPGDWVAAAMMGLLGVAIGASGPVVGSLWAEVYGVDQLGGVRATSGAMMVLSSSMSPILAGWFIDQGCSAQEILNGAACFFAVALGGQYWSFKTAKA